MAPDKLRVGVIGAGVGTAHLKGYSKMPQVEIVALAGLDDDRVRLVADTYNVPQTYHDYERLLERPDIDAVSVCLPNALHAPVSIEAMQAGKHVLVEKPLARNAAEGRAMLAAAKQHDRVLMVSFNYRHRGDVAWLKKYVDAGRLGEIYYAKAYWMRRAGIPRLGSWFVSKETAGGGPLIDLGVHVLDMAMYLMGEPHPVAVSGNTYAKFGPRNVKGWETTQFSAENKPYEVEDLASAFIRLDNGATLTLEASWATHSSYGDDFGIALFGTEGGAEITVRNYGQTDTLRIFHDVDGLAVDSAPKTREGEGHSGVVAQFVSAIMHGTPAVPSAEDGLRRALVLDGCYRSAEAGREVLIEEL
jgi:predicted dehydrogenase